MSVNSVETRPERHANGRFGPGNPGRPVGSYGRVSRRAALAILGHFETNQDLILEQLVENPALYIKLLARVLPRQIEACEVDPASWSEAEAAQAFIHAKGVILNQAGDRRKAMAMLESLMMDRPDHLPKTPINGD